MSWLVVLFAIEAGLVHGHTNIEEKTFWHPGAATYVDMDFELNAGVFFVGGNMVSYQVFRQAGGMGLLAFTPYHIGYGFRAGIRVGNVEVGWDRWCEHPVVAYDGKFAPQPAHDGYTHAIDATSSRFYVRGEFSTKGSR